MNKENNFFKWNRKNIIGIQTKALRKLQGRRIVIFRFYVALDIFHTEIANKSLDYKLQLKIQAVVVRAD